MIGARRLISREGGLLKMVDPELIAATLAAGIISRLDRIDSTQNGVQAAVKLYRDILDELVKAPSSQPSVQGRPIR
jgi:hypothetical protein